MKSFLEVLQSVPDPRAGNVRHNLTELLVIAFLAVLCGATNCCEMAEFGRTKRRFLKRFLKLRHGTPSHDTFSNVLRALDPAALDAAFGSLTRSLMQALGGAGVVAIDGKSLKRAYDSGQSHMPSMMVTAYATALRFTLASRQVKGGNECEAALEVIGLLDLRGQTVTTDALHCNRDTAAAVMAKKGDYCLVLKANQSRLHAQAQARLAELGKRKGHAAATSRMQAHGRGETRTARVVAAPGAAEQHDFPGLKAFGCIETVREREAGSETDVRFFALSRVLSPQELLETARAHWQIENGLHWVLDVVLREDAARNRKDNGPANIAVLRRRALDAARRDKSKGSLTIKLKRAAWDDDFLIELLSQMR